MINLASDSAMTSAVALLTHYSFDYGDLTAERLMDQWLRSYPAQWVRLALVEALYQGRYKAISVEQILAFWQRRGQPVYHFNHEFERLVCTRFPQNLLDDEATVKPPVSKQTKPRPRKTQPTSKTVSLNPETHTSTAGQGLSANQAKMDILPDLPMGEAIAEQADPLTESVVIANGVVKVAPRKMTKLSL